VSLRSNVQVRKMASGEARSVLDLVMRAFDDAVRPDFSEQGVAEFTRSARGFLIDSPEGHAAFVAEPDGEPVGIIDIREPDPICLFFVAKEHRREGIGAELLDRALDHAAACGSDGGSLTVNSAPSAVRAYERFGFQACAPEREVNGIRFVAMSRPLPRD